MTQTFNCPTCGAPLTFDGSQVQVKCLFCGSSVVVPETLRSRRNKQIGPETAQYIVSSLVNNASPQSPMVTTVPVKSGGCIAFVILLIVLVSVGIPIIAVIAGLSQTSEIIAAVTTNIPGSSNIASDIQQIVNSASSDGSAPILMTFGSEGKGSGFFDDMRYVALDGKGNIYTAEYMSGRVQMFDGEGKFIKSWIADGNKFPLRGLDVDRQGLVYVSRAGSVLKYNAESAELISKIDDSSFYDDLVVLPDGGALVVDNGGNDAIVRFNAAGKQLKRINDPIAQATDDSELSVKIAVDGTGNIYALGGFTNMVYKFSPDGKFINKFGGAGDEPGLFRATQAIAIDGQDQVYVSDISGIHVFDANGRFVKHIKLKPGTVAFGMTFNDKNELFIAARDKVLKIAVVDPAR